MAGERAAPAEASASGAAGQLCAGASIPEDNPPPELHPPSAPVSSPSSKAGGVWAEGAENSPRGGQCPDLRSQAQSFHALPTLRQEPSGGECGHCGFLELGAVSVQDDQQCPADAELLWDHPHPCQKTGCTKANRDSAAPSPA